jgi:hypothetical protein
VPSNKKRPKVFAIYIKYRENYSIDNKTQEARKIPSSAPHPGVEASTMMRIGAHRSTSHLNLPCLVAQEPAQETRKALKGKEINYTR